MGAIANYLKAARELTKMRGKKFSVSRTRGPKGERIVNVKGISDQGPSLWAGKTKAIMMPTHFRDPRKIPASVRNNVKSQSDWDAAMSTAPIVKTPRGVLQHELNHYNDRTHVPRGGRLVTATNNKISRLYKDNDLAGVEATVNRTNKLFIRNTLRAEAKANIGMVKERTKRKKTFSANEKEHRSAMASYLRMGKKELPDFRQRYKNFKAAGGYSSPTAHLKLSTDTCWNNLMESLDPLTATVAGTFAAQHLAQQTGLDKVMQQNMRRPQQRSQAWKYMKRGALAGYLAPSAATGVFHAAEYLRALQAARQSGVSGLGASLSKAYDLHQSTYMPPGHIAKDALVDLPLSPTGLSLISAGIVAGGMYGLLKDAPKAKRPHKYIRKVGKKYIYPKSPYKKR